MMAEVNIEKENLALVAKAKGGLINDHRLELIDEYWTEDTIQHDPMIDNGREPFKMFIKGWLNAMPDLRWDPILASVASYDQVWIYGRYSGTFKNDWMGIPANNKQVEFTAAEILRVENGMIAEHWDVLDLKTMFEQMSR